MGLLARPTLADPPTGAVEFAVIPHIRTRATKIVVFGVGGAWPVQDAVSFLPIVVDGRGYGMDSVAGSGRKAGQGTSALRKVTNTNASGAGSFKQAVDDHDSFAVPSTVVFETSGTITLSSRLTVNQPYLTIAGQTAPSPGITIKGGQFRTKASELLVQHMRFRLGPPEDNDCDRGRAMEIEVNQGASGITNIVFDHCSFSWGTDQIISIWREVGAITMRRCIFSEALNNNCHTGGPHAFGPLTGGDGEHQVAWIGNLFAHNDQRSPSSRSQKMALVNNVIYNWGLYGTGFQSQNGFSPNITKSNCVGNSYIEGADSTDNKPMHALTGSHSLNCNSQIWIDDNVSTTTFSEQFDLLFNQSGCTDAQLQASVRIDAVWPDGLVAAAGSDAEGLVLASCGARPADRDAVDIAIVNDVQNLTGKIIDSQTEVGGWPTLAENTSAFVDPANPDAITTDYTNREDHLHNLSAALE